MNSNDNCNLNLDAESPTSFRSENHGLYAEAENRILRRIIKDCSDPELPAEHFFKCTRAFCDLKKEDSSREKNAVALFVARERAARAKDRSARTTRPPEVDRHGRSPAFDPDPDLAPWGRNSDGIPYTEEEFQISLAAAVRDIYGLDPFPNLPDAPDPETTPDSTTGVTRNPTPCPPSSIASSTVPTGNGPNGSLRPSPASSAISNLKSTSPRPRVSVSPLPPTRFICPTSALSVSGSDRVSCRREQSTFIEHL